MSPKVTINKLLRLADFLRNKVPAERFDMNFYLADIEDTDSEIPKEPLSLKPSCGTAGCIAGWASVIEPSLKQNIMTGGVVCGTWTDSDAFREVYGISDQEAWELLLMDFEKKDTPQSAADTVEELAQKIADREGYEIVEEKSGK